MDVHKHSAFERLEIVETGRRRRWSDDEKFRIVMETQSEPRLLSATARPAARAPAMALGRGSPSGSSRRGLTAAYSGCVQLVRAPSSKAAPATNAIGRYIDGVYNPVRRHSALDIISPLQFEKQAA